MEVSSTSLRISNATEIPPSRTLAAVPRNPETKVATLNHSKNRHVNGGFADVIFCEVISLQMLMF